MHFQKVEPTCLTCKKTFRATSNFALLEEEIDHWVRVTVSLCVLTRSTFEETIMNIYFKLSAGDERYTVITKFSSATGLQNPLLLLTC